MADPTYSPAEAPDPRLIPPPPADNLPANPIPESCLLVGVGASAGGVQALRKFFSATRAEAGMTYLVVLHQSPDYESHLPQVIQAVCELPVVSVSERTAIEPNHVYVVPPNHHLYVTDGWIRLREITDIRGRLVPIDLCFRSLAETHPGQSACVVLSGTGSDGTQGLKRLKEAGGFTFVQEPADAEQTEMPRSAIETRMVDCVALAVDLPERMSAMWRVGQQIRLPAPDQAEKLVTTDEAAAASLREVLALVRVRTGHDFSQYKRATIVRRISRRMQVTQVATVPDYLGYLREHSPEVQNLLRDFMISVTEFFRDSEAFEALERQVLPRLFAGRTAQDQIRIWVPACATGEEAYSIAMLMFEHVANHESPARIQIFASDIDENAINIAREGVYEETVAADMTPERLRRFFIKDGPRYRVKKELRESVLFATQNVLNDPPFSRLDLVSCRNLLIYLSQDIQERLLELFHFSLKPDGYLFLGSSESAEENMGLFAPLDKKHRMYARRPGHRAAPNLFGNTQVPHWVPRHRLGNGEELAPRPISYADLHLRVLEHAVPANILVNENYEIIHLSDEAGRYLRFPGGEPSHNLLRVVHPDLRLELRTALYTVQQKHTLEVREVAADLNGQTASVRITVRPVEQPESARGFTLVFFEEVEPEKQGRRRKESPQTEPLARQLEDELQRVKGEMRTVVEQYETANEEMRASNEELQAINEELRSATEELETSKEELQSLNEELTTVNQELKSKVDELSRANSDLQNLMASTLIGTIFLDRELRIKRYTPAAQSIFKLIPTDAGRPLADLSHSLHYPQLSDDAHEVLEKLSPVEREVRSNNGGWYLVRHTPYRTVEDRIDGVVVTFLDVSERIRANAAQEASEERFRVLVEGASDYAMFLLDPDRRVIFWSAGTERVLGYSRSEIMGEIADLIFTPEDRANDIPVREAETAKKNGAAPDKRWHLRKNGERFWADGIMTVLRTSSGELRGFAKVFRDATEEKQAQDELGETRDQLEERVRQRTAELEQANAQRQALARELVSAEEAERRRIARELHDQTGQQLAALILEQKRLKDSLQGNSEAEASLQRLDELANRIGQHVHALAFELRPTSLDDVGLARALENYINDWSSRSGIPADFHASAVEGEQRMAPEAETALYRIVQEALHNVSRHAGKASVSVILERRDSHVQAIVEDTGHGFDVEEHLQKRSSEHLGIGGMQERAALLGGKVTIESTPGQGTTVFARIPDVPYQPKEA